MNQEIKQQDTSTTTEQPKTCCSSCNKCQLTRLLYMILFVAIKYVAVSVFYLIALFQFFHMLFTQKTNKPALDFNQSLSTYLYQIFTFIGYNTETKPFPFSPWPKQ